MEMPWKGSHFAVLLLLSAIFTSQVLGASARVENVRLSRELIDNRPALGVSWTAPQRDQTIVRYLVQYRRAKFLNDGNPWHSVNVTGTPPATTTNLTRLRSSTKYLVRVRAFSYKDKPVGQASVLVQGTTYGTAEPHFESLSEVVALKVECATPQAKHFLPTEQYEVQYRRVGHLPVNPWHSVNITGTPPLTTTYLEGLRKKTAYWVRVRAVSAVGPGRRWHMQQYITSGV